ncbi:acyl-CoA dehydrogenase family protein [Parendozoicomonas sp. Alg238-R29]|uniref:acyl-CoA dehydrogenase family protein n=1 Tax=Parendozoicomonas sp. Alg238-R29 TaxID=2993446 RepID=UPI00248F1083|nr:acyl-CoA dehydrogenase family protein [Parendozoicomonas sp. Alg238-R29]
MNAIGFALNLTNRFAGSPLVSRLGLRKPAEKLAYTVTKQGFTALIKGQETLKNKRKNSSSSNPQKAESRSSLLFDLNLSDEQLMIRDNAERLAENLRTNAESAAKARQPSEQTWQESDELGMGYFVLPESFEGMEMAHASETWQLLTEELARGDMGQALALLSPVSAALCITRWGQPSLKKHWLDKLAESGRIQGTLAHQEPGTTQTQASLNCIAKAKSSGYRLNGTKTLVALSSTAEFFLVTAALSTKENGLFLIPRNSKGLTVSPTPAMGLHSADTGSLTLKNVDIPKDHQLNANSFCFQQWLSLSQIAASALACGTSQAVLDYTVPYCNEREAFGEPISHRQSVAFMIADIATELEGMRLLTTRAASRAERGDSCTREARLAHYLCCTKGMEIGTDGVQLLGGHGFIQEHPVERWYRDLRAIPLLAGSLII